jgi:hypothetical protein
MKRRVLSSGSLGRFVFSALLTVVAVLGIPPAAARANAGSCTGVRAHIHSLTEPHSVSDGLIRTTDQSVILTLDRPAGSDVTTWQIQSPLLATVHHFNGLGNGNEERLDASDGIVNRSLKIGQATCTITLVTLNRQKVDGGPLVALVIPGGRSWTPVALGRVELSPNMALDDSFVDFDGRMLRLTGHLRLANAVSSRDLVVVTADANGLAYSAPPGQSAVFFFENDKNSLVVPPLHITSFKIAVPDKTPYRKVSALDIGAQLELPQTPNADCNSLKNGEFKMTADGKSFITLQYERAQDGTFDGNFVLPKGPTGSKPAQQFSWCFNNGKIQNHKAVLSMLKIFPRGDSKVPDHPFVAVLGTYSPDESKSDVHLVVTAVGLSPGDVVYPVATFQFAKPGDPSQPAAAQELPKLPGIDDGDVNNRIAMSGTFNPDGNNGATVTISGRVHVWRPATDGSPNESEIMGADLTGIVAKVPPGMLGTPTSWALDFSGAQLSATEASATVFGHMLASCDTATAKTLDLVKKSLGVAHDLCVGLHIHADAAADDTDVAYGVMQLSDSCDSAAAPPSCSNGHRLSISGFDVTLPSKDPVPVRFGLGTIDVQGVHAQYFGTTETSARSNPFIDAIGADRLYEMNCSHIDIQGSADIMSVNLPTSLAQTYLAPAKPTPVHPTFGIGDGCEVFVMNGYLPLQLTPNSSMIVTSLIILNSKPVTIKAYKPKGASAATKPVDFKFNGATFVQVAGAITSGNVTIVLTSLGFRNLTGLEASDSKCNAKDHHETQYGSVCATHSIDWKLTTAITGVRNADEIGKALTGLGSFALGLIVKH